ncbi:hypothetical protein K438DRAFT_1862640, partial [Mycena galopus ATCC 62051]
MRYSGPTVVLPHLRRLETNSPKILDHLNAPMLDTLVSLDSGRRIEAFLPFVQGSGCLLTKLILMHCRISSDLEVITLLRALPTLTCLFLEICFDTLQAQNTLFEALFLDGTSSDVCPNLTSLLYGYRLYRGGVESVFLPDPFFAMVWSRFEIGLGIPDSIPPSRLGFLRVFHIGTSLYPPGDILARLKTLRDVGLDAVFLNYRKPEDIAS